MTTVVQKYGGSSVSSIDKMREIAARVARRIVSGDSVVVVVSAMGKTTNHLIEQAQTATASPAVRELDMLLSTGEQASAALMALLLNDMGVKAVSLTGGQAGILVRGRHTKGKIVSVDTSLIEQYVTDGITVVVAGFQGTSETGDIITLGRGGSDTTAVALASSLGCGCEIYTDVAGIYCVDPRRYPSARKLDHICYEEIQEMAHLGAKVMEPRSVEIGQRFGVPILVASSTGDLKGTLISDHKGEMEMQSVTGLSVTDDVLMVTLRRLPYIPMLIARLFTMLATADVLVDMISQTSPVDGLVSLSFTAHRVDRETITKVINEVTTGLVDTSVLYDNELAKLSAVGLGMRTQTGVAARIFRLFARHNIEFLQVSTSEISISYTMRSQAADLAVGILAREFGLASDNSSHPENELERSNENDDI
ncbi:MAG TPA: aspartate kinase [Bacillota bacterium]|nr:aspartate kinase [Bacillota bacterium]